MLKIEYIELNKKTLAYLLEKSFNKDLIKKNAIEKIIPDGENYLIKLCERFEPLTDSQYNTRYVEDKPELQSNGRIKMEYTTKQLK